jgi:two-component system, sensor histidine kinase and response regulator
MPGKLKYLILRALLAVYAGIILSVAQAAGPRSISEYIEQFREAETPVRFDSVFGDMINSFHAGNLSFTDDEVLTIIEIAKNKPYSNAVLAAVYGWAGTMFGNGRMEEAVAYFMESAFLYEKQGKNLGHALSCFEIALIQHKAGNFDEALDYYNTTLAIGKDSLGHRTKINCYNGFALIHRERQSYDSAINGFRSAYNLARLHRDSAWMGILSGNIASVHLREQRYDSSLEYYFENLRLIKKTTEVENEIETYASIGKVYLKQNDEQLAFRYLDSAVSIIDGRKIAFNDFFNPMDEINETYAHLYAARGDFVKAFEYHTKFHQVAQEKQGLLNGRRLKQLQSTFAFRQKQNELDLLQQVNEANLATIQQQRYAQFAFAGIILLLGFLAFIAYSTSRQRKKMNRELSHSNEELERLNTIKDKLFSVISHDLRGPLSNLKSILKLLDAGHLSQEEFHTLSQRLNHQIETSGSTLENLLQWAKAQLSEIKVNPEKVVLSEVTRKVVHQFHQQLQTKKIGCINQLTPELMAWADTNQVEIILRNIIGNAIKFTPAEGLITVDGRKTNDQFIEIAIEDNGIGMSDTQVKELFQPGRHFTNPGTNQEKGTGIGLIITREMIANNGGVIKIKSTVGKGTVFTFRLPALVVEQAR